MSGLDDNKNMVLFQGFPEVPQDAFIEFELDDNNFSVPPPPPLSALPPPQLLFRSYKAICKCCGNRSETYNPLIRIVICFMCENVYVKTIQSVVRGFCVRQKLRKLRKKELIHRWFISRGLEGVDFASLIASFI